jgi:hypothetical protein
VAGRADTAAAATTAEEERSNYRWRKKINPHYGERYMSLVIE